MFILKYVQILKEKYNVMAFCFHVTTQFAQTSLDFVSQR
jgi:hypothetical protein